MFLTYNWYNSTTFNFSVGVFEYFLVFLNYFFNMNPEAVPKKILELMSVPGLTRENVASHLQVIL